MFAKLNVFTVFKAYTNVLKDYQTDRLVKTDVFLFLILPVLVGIILPNIGFTLDNNLTGYLINFYAIFAGLLFNLLIYLFDKVNKISGSNLSIPEAMFRLRMLEQIRNIVSVNIIFSLFGIIFLILSSLFKSIIIVSIFSGFSFSFVTFLILNLFYLLKGIDRVMSDEITFQKREIRKNHKSGDANVPQ